jgi:hypothetical protein
MKKSSLLLLSVCFLFILSSCKKHSPAINVTGTFTATINGTPETFNVGAAAQTENVSGFYSLSLVGVQSTSVANSMLISINSSTPITAGTYTGASTQASISYTLASGSIYQYDNTEGSSATVTIKSISSTSVQGTFSGTLNIISGNGAATQTLTNGTFNLNIQQASNN